MAAPASELRGDGRLHRWMTSDSRISPRRDRWESSVHLIKRVLSSWALRRRCSGRSSEMLCVWLESMWTSLVGDADSKALPIHSRPGDCPFWPHFGAHDQVFPSCRHKPSLDLGIGFCRQVQWISRMGGVIGTGMVSFDLDFGVVLLADRLARVASSLSAGVVLRAFISFLRAARWIQPFAKGAA